MIYEGRHRISYYDLDLRGSIKLSALLKMIHIAADVNANELSIGFEVMHAKKMSFILQRIGFGIKRMPGYNENPVIRTWPDSTPRGTFIRKGDMHDERGSKLMEWTSMWILFDIEARKILKPSALGVTLPVAPDRGVIIEPKKIFVEPEAFGEEYSSHIHTVRYADVDTNMHMNNSIYGDLICNALFPTGDSAAGGLEMQEVQINYFAETRLGEEIEISAFKSTGGFLVTGKSKGRNSFAAEVK